MGLTVTISCVLKALVLTLTVSSVFGMPKVCDEIGKCTGDSTLSTTEDKVDCDALGACTALTMVSTSENLQLKCAGAASCINVTFEQPAVCIIFLFTQI